MDAKTDDSAGKCPVTRAAAEADTGNRDWWPEHLDIGVLHTSHPSADPMGKASTTPRNSRASTSTR